MTLTGHQRTVWLHKTAPMVVLVGIMYLKRRAECQRSANQYPTYIGCHEKPAGPLGGVVIRMWGFVPSTFTTPTPTGFPDCGKRTDVLSGDHAGSSPETSWCWLVPSGFMR